jgi:hypothetical protein
MRRRRVAPFPMVDQLERSDAAAQRSGVPVDQVTSPAGALGRHQVMPSTGALYGFGPGRTSHRRQGNEAAALANLADLADQGFTDPALMAAGYNGGPRRARADRVQGQTARVPRETQDYYSRALSLMAEGAGAAAKPSFRRPRPRNPIPLPTSCRRRPPRRPRTRSRIWCRRLHRPGPRTRPWRATPPI